MSQTLTETVPAALAGERLDRCVALMADVSRAEASALVGDERVRVDGTPVTRGADRVTSGATIEIDVDETETAPKVVTPEPDVDVTIALVDDHVVVVDKPPGLVVHPGAGHAEGTLVAGLLARFPEMAGVGDPTRPGIVHRLDVETSGLLVAARTQHAFAGLVAQLAARTVERRYVALVVGHPETAQGLVDAPIGRSPRHPTLMAVRAEGKEARTHFEVTETYTRPSAAALLMCRLETGRTHQIRVHMKAIGHPVVGDTKYGGGRAIDCPRLFLHATRLAFRHPVTDDTVEITSPLPPDLAAVLHGMA